MWSIVTSILEIGFVGFGMGCKRFGEVCGRGAVWPKLSWRWVLGLGCDGSIREGLMHSLADGKVTVRQSLRAEYDQP